MSPNWDDWEFIEIGRTYRDEVLPCGVRVHGPTLHMQMRLKNPWPDRIDDMVGYDDPAAHDIDAGPPSGTAASTS